MRAVHSARKASLPTLQSTSPNAAMAAADPSWAACACWAARASWAAAMRASSSLRAASSAARRAASSSASMAAMPWEMSRDVALTKTVASRASESDASDANPLRAADESSLKESMPNEVMSRDAPLPAEAKPNPMHPASTHDTQPAATIAATMPVLRCLMRFSAKASVAFRSRSTRTRPAEAVDSVVDCGKDCCRNGRYAVLTGPILADARARRQKSVEVPYIFCSLDKTERAVRAGGVPNDLRLKKANEL